MKTVIRYSGQIKRNILILEKNEKNREVLRSALEPKYELQFVGSGAEAFIHLHKNNFSLVIVELNENQEDRIAFLDLYFQSE